jgi:hypothetical protein
LRAGFMRRRWRRLPTRGPRPDHCGHACEAPDQTPRPWPVVLRRTSKHVNSACVCLRTYPESGAIAGFTLRCIDDAASWPYRYARRRPQPGCRR